MAFYICKVYEKIEAKRLTLLESKLSKILKKPIGSLVDFNMLISDWGSSIDKDVAQKLFMPFYTTMVD